MKVCNYLLTALLALFMTNSIFASGNDDPLGFSTGALDVVNEKDLWAVRDWLKSKRIELHHKSGDLSVSGEVRAEWRNMHEKLGSTRQVGIGSVSGLANNQYDVEVNLYFDYSTEKSWTAIKLEFDNAMGMLSGDINQIVLERAFVGYTFYDDGLYRIDGMLGRQRMYDLYDSEVQFNSTADGATVNLNANFECITEMLLKGGIYLADATEAQPFWIFEATFWDIGCIGLYAEYSFITWAKSGTRFRNDPTFQYSNHQATIGYVFSRDWWPIDTRIFTAFVINQQADPNVMQRLTNGVVRSRENWAWYVALQVGTVEKAMDWAAQFQYQGVQAQSIPDFDVSGIGRGNSLNSQSFINNVNGLGNGNANYSGWELDGLFALSDNIVLEARFQRAVSQEKKIGRPLSYTNFQIEAIYGF